ncbi:zinc carboxypeptidase-like [Schistocerca americana]|uniref:zinc carboxypeptidase-like n=1 Tax=Schistocerca americana TaxID=7009 RepID=UPI001F4F30DD|nr:zinc carboxypeptidase-like [Schistocerca americana]
MLWRVALLVLAALSLAAGEPLRFDGHRVYRVTPKNKHHVQFLNALAGKYHNDILFWKDARVVNRTADIMVSPEMQNNFLEALEKKGMKSSVYVEDVQKLIDAERPAKQARASFGWDDYYTVDEIYAWLDSLAASYPSVVTTVVGGSSYEGREIRGVKISYGTGNPAVVIEGGIHAREWISAASVTWFINEILTSTDASVRSIVESFDFYIFPNTNPDGYEYTWTNNRMWRKTRKPYLLCVGADPNRNWDFHWAEEGASSISCSETYAGSEAFSEVETKSLSEFLTGLGSDLQVYLSFHSYSQLLMYPYGLSSVVADNAAELQQMVEKSAQALASRYGTQYTVGSIVNAIYAAAGSSIDWAMGQLGLRYAFVWELRDTGSYGFLLPADQIIPTSEETFDSILSILEDVQAALRSKKQLH